MHHPLRFLSPIFIASLALFVLGGAAEPPYAISGKVPGAAIELCVVSDPDDFALARQLLGIEKPACGRPIPRDPEGRFEFVVPREVRKQKLQARFPGGLDFTTWYLNENLDLPDLAPLAPSTFGVRVADEAGKPVAGARVYIHPVASPLPKPWRADPRQAVSDAGGYASLPYWPGERFGIAVVAPSFKPWTTAERATPAELPFPVVLEPRPARRVQVLSEPGRPLEGVTVTWNGLPLGLTDARGRLEVFVDDGDILSFASPRHRRWFFLSQAWKDGVLITYDGGGAMLTGRVRDPLGRPAAGARVQLRQPGGRAEELRTAADGGFVFGPLGGGSYQLRASAAGFGDAVGRVDFEDGGYTAQHDHFLDLELQAGEANLGGRVSDLDGSPIEGAEVRVLRRMPYAPLPDPENPAIGSADARSDRGGTWLLGGLQPGEKVELELRAAGKVPRILSPVAADGSLTVDVRLATEAVLEIAAVDVGGAAVAGAQIEVVAAGSEGQAGRRATSDAGGLARLAALPVGAYQVTIKAQDLFQQELPLVLEAGLRRLPLQLERGATLEGNFVDADDQKVAGAAISVRDPRQPERILAADTTNSEGYFRFAGIPAGKWHLVAAAPSWPPQTEDLEIGREELYRRDFQLPPGETLRGIVLTADRQPAAGAQVSLTDPERRMGSDMIFSLASMTTDGSGTFSFDKLGRHRLELSAWLPRHYTAHREVLPGKDQFVEIVLDPPPP